MPADDDAIGTSPLRVLGHRGGRGDGWPAENSIAAFERALAEGAHGVELDVRLSRDGELVLHHDPRFPDGRSVAASARGALATLEEALAALRGRIVNVEVKPDVPRRFALCRAVARCLGRTSGVEVVVSSFDPAIVLAMAALAPRVPRAILVGERTPRLATRLPLAMRRFVAAAHLQDALITPAAVRRLEAAGLRVVAWTVNSEARARELADWGVEWVITDVPEKIVAAHVDRGGGRVSPVRK